ncbi:MAG: twin-arginine translocase subunit TatB [Cycloclasticus sp.]|nr:twin-arginine translocase subunit TatB [Cycloclasticus sp.]MBQ0790182.1 twin-arginine translocase subunit TatB [Cycloclasticus sp.]
MFDIGFFELCLIGIIALLVIGPEKLPRVARTVGLWVGKAQGLVKTVKYEIDEQLRTEELKQSMQQATTSVKNQVSETIEDVEANFNDLRDELKTEPQEDINEPTATPDKKQNQSVD